MAKNFHAHRTDTRHQDRGYLCQDAAALHVDCVGAIFCCTQCRAIARQNLEFVRASLRIKDIE